MKKLFFLALIFCFHSTICLADMCTAMPSCTELGYYRGTNIACGDDDSRYITCPYDPDYRKCVNYDCEEMGFVKDGLEQLLTWCQNIIFCKKDKSYVLCGDIDGPNTVCVPVYCAGVTPPSNAYGTTSCTPQDVDCEYGDQVYTAWNCIGGYHKTDDETACEPDCIPTTCSGGVTVPTNAHSTATCAPRYSNCKFGDEVVTAWACDQGYHTNAAGTGCDPDCEEVICGAAVSVPANAHSTGQCTPRAGNCSLGSTIDTGWACNDGYHEKNGACEADCTVVSCGAAISSKPANASYTTCTTRDKNCNTTTVNVDWVCNTNFHKNSAGTACEADCPVVTCGAAISSKPANSSYTTCTATDKNCNTNTVNTGWACNSGFHEKNDACEADCSVVTCGAAVTLPPNAHCTNNCTPRDKNCNNTGEARCTAWDCNSGYKKNSAGTGCELGCAVQTCGSAISSKPANSDYITCTTMDQDCNTNTINVDWECKSGYHKNSAGTGCTKDCTVQTCGSAISSKPANSEYITCTRRNTSCNTSKVNVDWACVSGYHKNSAGTGCDVDCSTNDCATINIPANANGTGSCTPRYSDCSYGSSKFTGWECKPGYHKNSAQTGCDKDCTVKNCDPGVSVPNNAYGTTSCTPKDKNCNDGSIVYYAWECNSGYHKNSAGTGCDKDATCTVVTCTASTPPSHAHGTSPCTPVHSDCTTDPAVNTSWECDSGYEKCSGSCKSNTGDTSTQEALSKTENDTDTETDTDSTSCTKSEACSDDCTSCQDCTDCTGSQSCTEYGSCSGSQNCGCGGTKTYSGTKTRSGTQTITGTKCRSGQKCKSGSKSCSGTKSRTKSRTRGKSRTCTRTATWDACSQSWSYSGWSCGSWIYEKWSDWSYEEYGACICTLGSCVYGDYGSCVGSGNYGSCSGTAGPCSGSGSWNETQCSWSTCSKSDCSSGQTCVSGECLAPCQDSSSANHYSTSTACDNARLQGGMYDFGEHGQDRDCNLDQSHYLTSCYACAYSGKKYYEQRCDVTSAPDISGAYSSSVGHWDSTHHKDAITIGCGYKSVGSIKCPYYTVSFNYPDELGDITVARLQSAYGNCLQSQSSLGIWYSPSTEFICAPNY